MSGKKKRRYSDTVTAGFVLSLGFSFLSTVFMAGYLGFLMDKRSGGRHFTPLGILLGLLLAFHRTYTVFKALSRDKD